MLPLLLSLLLSPAPQAPALAQEAPEASPYARWSNGPSQDPAWFPIGVWLQDPSLAGRYKQLGINTFVGLWQGPTREQLRQLKEAQVSVICSMTKQALEQADKTTIIAWMQEDEPDNQKLEPAKLKARYEQMTQRDPTRPVWLNLGQGVANDQWKGRLSPREWYPQYAATADILSFDIYPVTNIKRDDGADFLWWIAKGLERMQRWTRSEKPLWNLIECTRVHQAELKPTPAQVESEVWISLVNGSQGIVYFCHNFTPRTQPAALLADEEMSRAVRAINERVLRYAPQLNRPSVPDLVEVECSDPKARVALMAKRFDGWTYLFCVGMRNQATQASFKLKGSSLSGNLQVLDEKRHVPLREGVFEDSFEPYQVHLYRFRDS